jgi:cytochrome c biogenesis protein CcmG, thiol:disulfide interchange protein DsbE
MTAASPPRTSWLTRALRLTVALVLVGLVVVLANGFRRDPRDIRTATIGQTAPAFDLERLDQTGRLRLADHAGKVVVVNFFASWCLPCKEEAPALVRMWERYRSANVVFVGIVYQDSPEAARAFHQRMGQTWPIAMDDSGRTAIAFGVFGIPETYFIRPDGVIAGRHVGTIDEETLRRAIDAIRPLSLRRAPPITTAVDEQREGRRALRAYRAPSFPSLRRSGCAPGNPMVAPVVKEGDAASDRATGRPRAAHPARR